MTRAAPKVADYPFTTLEPVLGTLDGDERQLVIADIPGLIEGAAEGAGLGHDFLAHVERTRLLVHVLDLAPLDGSDPVENFATIEAELAAYDPRLAGLPRILALSQGRPRLARGGRRGGRRLAGALRRRPPREEWEDPDPSLETPVLVTSLGDPARARRARARAASAVSRSTPPRASVLDAAEELAEHRVFRPVARKAFEVEQVEDGVLRVTGEEVERLIARHDLENEEALAHVEQRLHQMGVIRALEAQGFEPGDDVEIAGVVFELDPS